MKKNKESEPDIAELILKLQQQLSFLDKKIDTLIEQSSGKPEYPKTFQRFDQSHRQSEKRPDDDRRDRVLHKAICADCRKECEVPFRPSQDRPVYCKDCFSKRKGGGSFKGSADNGPRRERPFQASHFARPHGGEKKRFPEKKRPAVKRRKSARLKAAA